MKRYVFCFLYLLLHVTAGLAQTSDVTKTINKVKRDTNYLYAEATTKDVAEALLAAKSILEVKVGDWARSTHPNEGVELCIAKAKEHCFEVQTRRGDYYRAFVYVKKSDMLPVSDKQQVLVFQVDPTDEKIPSQSQEDVLSENDQLVETPQAIVLTPIEQKMLTINSFYDVEPFVKRLKAEGRLEAYGKYATRPVDSDCHMFIYSKEGVVKAVLRQSSGTIVNLATQKEDGINNYKGCGAIWIKIKN